MQPFVDGETVCTYSTVHDGRVSSHLMYRIPRQWHHSTGLSFESVDAAESLRLIEPILTELRYTGQVSFDFIVTDGGLSFVECNPRATDGLLLLPSGELARGLLDPEADLFLLPAGHTVQLELAVLGRGLLRPPAPAAADDPRPRPGPRRRRRLARSAADPLLGALGRPFRRRERARAREVLRRRGRPT